MTPQNEEEPEIYKSHMYVALHGHVLGILDSHQPGDFLVFDIDDTLIRGHGPRTKPHLIGMTILREAKYRNIPIYYVTARPKSAKNKEATLDDLEKVGILPDPSAVFMRPPSADSWAKISRFKFASRKWIEDQTQGNCLMTIGDQWTDLVTVDSDRERDEMDLIWMDFFVLFNIKERKWGLKFKETPY